MLLKSRKGVLKNGESRGTKRRKEGRGEGKDMMKERKQRNRSMTRAVCTLLVAINMGNKNNKHLPKL